MIISALLVVAYAAVIGTILIGYTDYKKFQE